MPSFVPDDQSRPALGFALMAVAMLSIPIVDGIAKYLSAGRSPLFIAWERYAAATAVILPVAAARFGTRVLPAERRGSHLLRTIFLVTAMILYFLSIEAFRFADASTLSPLVYLELIGSAAVGYLVFNDLHPTR